MTAANDASSSTPTVTSPAPAAPSSVVTVSSEGLTINLNYDAAALAAPAGFRSGVEQAASLLAAAIHDLISVNIDVHLGNPYGTGAAGGPNAGDFLSYDVVRTHLLNAASPGDGIFGSLPAGTSLQGQNQVLVWPAQAKLFGFIPPNAANVDGRVFFDSSFGDSLYLGKPSFLVAIAVHELAHALAVEPQQVVLR